MGNIKVPVVFMSKQLLSILVFALLLLVSFSQLHAIEFIVQGSDGTPVTNYRWLIEEDTTFYNDPSVPVPPINPDAQGLNFHGSYMPLAAKGNTQLGQSAAGVVLAPNKRYFVSVMPNEARAYSLGGASFATGATGDSPPVSIVLNKLPLPTAQISVFVFHDNNPINNAPDLPQERGLEGFHVFLEEPAGRYGASGGPINYDAYGNSLGTVYLSNCGADGNSICVDEDGVPIPDPSQPASGVLRTNANGVVVIKNLAPAKYSVRVVPPAGQGWVQTSTIEGTKVIDAWVKANEPPYFTEFGPVGHHCEFGFVRPFTDTTRLTGGATISGQVRSIHMSRPPNYTFYTGAVFPGAWVGLNDLRTGQGVGVFAAPTTGESQFSIPNVPPGDYQVVIWDSALDIIFATVRLTVNPNRTCATPTGSCNLGNVGVFDWFGRVQGRVFYDTDGDGFPDSGEPGMPSSVNLRWRDGTVYQAAGTDGAGEYQFKEVFPFFSWLVAEVDFLAPYKATGITAVVDAGGPVLTTDGVPAHSEFAYPSYGRMTPQVQAAVNAHTGNALSRTERGPVLTQAFQVFLGQTNVIHWGKKTYNTSAGENGGISGMVLYKTTRSENNPQDDVAQNWEPGIPRGQVVLYQDADSDGVIDDINGIAGIQLADVDNYPFGWAEGTAEKGPEDIIRCGDGITFCRGDALEITWTDSWDDNQPTECPGDPADPFYAAGKCYDGLRNFNQVRPGVFDGGYAFPGYDAETGTGLRPGVFIVEAVPPPHYEIARSQDKNVDFGETYLPAGTMGIMAAPISFVPLCVGPTYIVPEHLSLFPGVLHPYYDPESPVYQGDFSTSPVIHNTCDKKQVLLTAGRNAAADFYLFTEVPIAGHVTGFILNDLANEFDPNNPNFGEKHALPFVPVSFKDWTGREITRVYSDQYGNYNALVPSTYTANLPMPSGMGPNMLIACMNDPGPIRNAGGQLSIDPYHKPQYTHFCYTFQYMPGATTYLDTPVEPIAAFAGQNQTPLDCEFNSRTPVVKSVTGAVAGPWVPASGGTLVITSLGEAVAVTNPEGGSTPTITRDFGFGTSGNVRIGETPLPVSSWSPTEIQATVPAGTVTGQLVVTRADSGRSSVTGITVHVGGFAPVVVSPSSDPVATPITDAIHSAAAGDLIIVTEGFYPELVIMEKPVRLQGVGAASTVISAVKAPGEKLQNWRDRISGLVTANVVDLLPGQALDFDPANNEPGLFNTTEGPGIIVLAKNAPPPVGFGMVGGRPNGLIDGFTITGSDIGGGIVVNGYARELTISNNKIINNAGIDGGGITAGHPAIAEEPVDSQNANLKIRFNHITQNGSRSGGVGGGISLYTGCGGYRVEENWVCGNFTRGSGGGIGHMGLSDGGLIFKNTVIFNQSFNQSPVTRPAGGGISIHGYAPVTGLTPGSGSVTIDRNLIHGNLAGAGDGGGIQLFLTNGQDVAASPADRNNWYRIEIMNNMITNNVAGMAGGAISLKDVAEGHIIHNTMANNDSVAVAGELINPLTGSSSPQPAGVVARPHSPDLVAQFRPNLRQTFSQPRDFSNNIIWHNRSFYWTITGGMGTLQPRTPDLYWDTAVLGTTGTLNCQNCIVSTTRDANPRFVREYFNNNGHMPIINENQAPLTSAAADEGGNFIDVRFGPLTLWDPNPPFLAFGDYHIQPDSTAVNRGRPIDQVQYPELRYDYDGQNRPRSNADIGADEVR